MEEACRLLFFMLILCDAFRYFDEMITEELFRIFAEIFVTQLKIFNWKHFGLLLLLIDSTSTDRDLIYTKKYYKRKNILMILNRFGHQKCGKHTKYLVLPGSFQRYYMQLFQNPYMTTAAKMCFEINRFASFSRTGTNYPMYRTKLAKEGFYYIHERNTCKCAFCGVEYAEWSSDDDISQVHERLSPGCPFLNDRTLPENIPWHSSSDIDDGYDAVQVQGLSPAVAEHGYMSSSQPFNTSSRLAINVPKYPHYQKLENRQMSFTNRWPHLLPDVQRIAEAGFFYTGVDDLVGCAFCGMGLSSWDRNSSPWLEHAFYSPRCYFVLREMGTDLVVSLQGINLRSVLQVRELTLPEGKQAGEDRAGDPGITLERPKYPAYAQLNSRISTYQGWPRYLDHTPSEMARAGFFYSGYSDYTRCFFCGGGLRNWEAGDVPWIEHARWFPKCILLQNRHRFMEIVLKQQDTIRNTLDTAKNKTPVTSGITTPNHDHRQPKQGDITNASQSGGDGAEELCETREIPQHPDYAQLNIRIRTFQGWPGSLDQTPRNMALAGLFYTGSKDLCRCFFCGGGLSAWEDGDDPWFEHARWFPKCPFLRQNVGHRFVELVQQKIMPASEITSSNDENPTAVTEITEINQQQTQSRQVPTDNTSHSETKSLLEEHNELKENMMCKICTNKEVSVAFVPCGHLACCIDCSSEIRICPLCRIRIKGVVKHT